MNEQREPSFKEDTGHAIAILNVWATALQLPLRRRIGGRVMGFTTVGAVIGTFMYGGLLGSVPVLVWGVILLISCFLHRIGTLTRWGRDDEPHSYYVGYPWLKVFPFRWADERQVRGGLEPVFMLFVAFLLGGPFGDAEFFFFAIGAVAMFITEVLMGIRDEDRKYDMRDSLIEGNLFRPNSKKRRW